MEEKKIVVYVLHGFWENEFTNGCAVVDVSIDLEAVMKKLDEIVESKAQGYLKVQEDKAEEERGLSVILGGVEHEKVYEEHEEIL